MLAYTPFGQKVFATGGNRRAADYAGINTRRVRFIFARRSAVCAAMAGIMYVTPFYTGASTQRPGSSANSMPSRPSSSAAAQSSAATAPIIGSLAGAAVITLIRALLSLQIITGPGSSFVMPQHWVNVFIGAILILAVLADIWVRQEGIHFGFFRLWWVQTPFQWIRHMAEYLRPVDAPSSRCDDISKAFGAVQALNKVDLALDPGEILGLVGDNSAGKSTLMKILTGAYHRDSGDILVDGAPAHFKSPHESRDVGIEMIYQDFALCGNMDVGQNIFLGRWPRRLFVDRKKMYREAEGAQATEGRRQLGLSAGRKPFGGRQQSVAIARAISFDPRVVILDEPTANLSVMAPNACSRRCSN